MNSVQLIGRLVKDIEMRYTESGKAVGSFRLAVNRNFKNKNGEYDADFINIVAWGPQAENAAKYIGKGSQVGITGKIKTRSYESKDGNRRFVVEVEADNITFLDSKKSKNKEEDFTPLDADEDDLPF